jgi:hypothetical protein
MADIIPFLFQEWSQKGISDLKKDGRVMIWLQQQLL